MKSILVLAMFLACAATANADGTGTLILFSSNDCQNPVGIVPTGTTNVSCDALPNASSYGYSIKLVGDTNCVPTGYITTANLCKAYNGK